MFCSNTPVGSSTMSSSVDGENNWNTTNASSLHSNKQYNSRIVHSIVFGDSLRKCPKTFLNPSPDSLKGTEKSYFSGKSTLITSCISEELKTQLNKIFKWVFPFIYRFIKGNSINLSCQSENR